MSLCPILFNYIYVNFTFFQLDDQIKHYEVGACKQLKVELRVNHTLFICHRYGDFALY